jgi:hypothetical protein
MQVFQVRKKLSEGFARRRSDRREKHFTIKSYSVLCELRVSAVKSLLLFWLRLRRMTNLLRLGRLRLFG